MTDLWRGSVAWADLDPVRGREQAGRRPVVVVASEAYLAAVTRLAIVIPVTTSARGWTNHVPMRGRTGLEGASWAMTEQVRTIDRDRVHAVVGAVDDPTLREIDMWLRDFLGV